MFGRRPATALAISTGLSLLAVTAVASMGAAPASADTAPAYSFHGTATDDAGRLQGTPTATFDQTAPTGANDHTQTGPSALVPTGPTDPNEPYWIGPYSGPLWGTIHISWYWSTANPATVALGTKIDVNVYADVDIASNTGTLIGSTLSDRMTLGPTPTKQTVDVALAGSATTNLLIQAAGHYLDSGEAVIVHYDSTSAPSSFTLDVGDEPPPPPPPPPGNWTQVGSYTPPIVRANPAMAFDPNSGQTLLFGGSSPNSQTIDGDTWTFDGSRWTEQHPATSPPGRSAAGVAYDAARHQIVLYGGFGKTATLADTWTWDGTGWTERHPAHSPPARALAAMAYDPATSGVVLFGGLEPTTGATLGDTWSWDGTDWTQEVPAVSPPPRFGSGFADGSATSKPLLFGGVTSAVLAQAFLNDTWTWDGSNHTWIPQATTSGPSPRAGQQMAYDPQIGKTLLYGGYNGFAPDLKFNDIHDWSFSTQSQYSDTWAWDGTGWTRLSQTSPPDARWYGGMAFDPVHSRMQLFGGLVWAKGWTNDTWGFDGTTWKREDLTAPEEMQNSMLAREGPRSSGAILFGGQVEYGSYSQETWRWDGAEWQYLTPAHSPLPRGMGALVFDPAAGTTLLFGGNVDTLGLPGTRQVFAASDTWTWDGTDWTELHPPTSPPGRYYTSAAYDAARGQVVLFGGTGDGNAGGDTWTWDGSTWTEQHPATSPPARFAAAMTYDPATQKVVLFGGSASKSEDWFGDTWTWDGTNWTEEHAAESPSPRAYASMAFDPRSSAAILFGGCRDCYGEKTDAETWSWDGSNWTLLGGAEAPYKRTDLSMLSGEEWTDGSGTQYSPMLMFGGRRPPLNSNGSLAMYDENGLGFTSDLWVFNDPGAVDCGCHRFRGPDDPHP